MQLNHMFRYEIPTIIEFGNASIKQLADHVKALGGSRVLIVGDPGVVQAGVVDHLTEPLDKAGIPYQIFRILRRIPI